MPGPIPIPILKVLSADFVTSAAAGGRTDGIPADGLAQIALPAARTSESRPC